MSFPCDDVLTTKRPYMELYAIEAQTYTFNMTPEDNKSLVSDQPIFVQLLGSGGTTAVQVTIS